jgi:hypothetical protein
VRGAVTLLVRMVLEVHFHATSRCLPRTAWHSGSPC